MHDTVSFTSQKFAAINLNAVEKALNCWCQYRFIKGAAKLLAPALDMEGGSGHDWCIKQCQDAGWDAAMHALLLVKSAELLGRRDHQTAMGLLQVIPAAPPPPPQPLPTLP